MPFKTMINGIVMRVDVTRKVPEGNNIKKVAKAVRNGFSEVGIF